MTTKATAVASRSAPSLAMRELREWQRSIPVGKQRVISTRSKIEHHLRGNSRDKQQCREDRGPAGRTIPMRVVVREMSPGEATVEFCVSSDLARSGAWQLGIGHAGMVPLVYAPLSKSQESAGNRSRLLCGRRFSDWVALAAARSFRANGFWPGRPRLCGAVCMDGQLHVWSCFSHEERDQMAEVSWAQRQEGCTSA